MVIGADDLSSSSSWFLVPYRPVQRYLSGVLPASFSAPGPNVAPLSRIRQSPFVLKPQWLPATLGISPKPSVRSGFCPPCRGRMKLLGPGLRCSRPRSVSLTCQASAWLGNSEPAGPSLGGLTVLGVYTSLGFVVWVLNEHHLLGEDPRQGGRRVVRSIICDAPYSLRPGESGTDT